MASSNGIDIKTISKFNTKSKNKLSLKKQGFIILFLIPTILLFAIIYAYPLVNIFITSFTKWDFKNLASPTFLGFDKLLSNYITLFTKDYYFLKSVSNSLKWVVLTGIVQVPFALIVALVLSKKPKGWVFIRNAFIIPNIISSAAIGLIFLNLYDPARGLITDILKLFKIDINILANQKTAFWAVTFSFILFGGTMCLLILAQIFSISTDIYEAARIDGASNWKIDLYITLPLLRPIIGTTLILACNYGLLLYNEIALITRGGPDNATYSMSFYIYKTAMGSGKLNFALANTAGVIQFIIGLLIVAIINWIFKTGKSDL